MAVLRAATIFSLLLLGIVSTLAEEVCDCNCDTPRSSACSQEDSPLCGENEVYVNGGGPCDTACAALGMRCQVNNIVAEQACYCKKGFARLGEKCVSSTSRACVNEPKAKMNNFRPVSPNCEACAPAEPDVCECNCDSESCRQEGSPLCGENEAFINGGSPCDTTCAAAGLDCLVENFLPAKGCYCLDGFARSAATGECVLANSTDCTSETKAEVNDFVAKAADCEACAPVTPNVCDCNCDSESCRQEDSPLCQKDNEVFINAGSPCDTACAALGQDCVVNNILPAKGCYCADGFARTSDGECVADNLPACTAEEKAEVNDFVPRQADCGQCMSINV